MHSIAVREVDILPLSGLGRSRAAENFFWSRLSRSGMDTDELSLSDSQRAEHLRIVVADLDLAISAQFAIAWAGENGEDPRLGWWKTDLSSEFGGEDLYQRLLPATWRWAVFQSLREVARRIDHQRRSEGHDADGVISLFSLGFEIDERIEDRITELKRDFSDPLQALPLLQNVIATEWNASEFRNWLSGFGKGDFTTVPIGRRLKGKPPVSLDTAIRSLLAAFQPLAESYPLPHFQGTM